MTTNPGEATPSATAGPDGELSDHPVVSVETAETLLSELREVKDDFAAVDKAVASLTGRDRAVKIATRQRAGLTVLGAGSGAGWAAAAVIAVEQLTGTGPGFAGVDAVITSLKMTTHKAGILMSAGAAAALGWFGGTGSLKEAAATAKPDEEFLRAGVAVELTLGELETALEEARQGRPGSAQALAEQVVDARKAFGHYVAALQELDDNDVKIRFPGWPQDVDVAEAHELLATAAGDVLAQTAQATITGVEGPLRRQLRMIASRSSAGGLDTVITSASALQKDLAAAGHALGEVEAVVRQAARHSAEGSGDEALERLAKLVTATQALSALGEANCASVESAAWSAREADTRQQILDHLRAAPSTATVRKSFEEYASGVLTAAAELAERPDLSVGAAGDAVWKARSDVPHLRVTVNDLVTAMDAELERAGQPAT